jgi:hypothetical protein
MNCPHCGESLMTYDGYERMKRISIKCAHDRIEALEAENARRKQDCDLWESDVKRVKAENAALRAEMDRMSAEARTHLERIAELRLLEVENEGRHRDKVDSLVAQLRAEVAELKAWREQAERTIRVQADAVDRAITIKMERDNVRAEVAEWQREAMEQREATARVRTMRDEARAEVANGNELHERLAEEVRVAQAEVAKLTTALQLGANRETMLHGDVLAARAEVERLREATKPSAAQVYARAALQPPAAEVRASLGWAPLPEAQQARSVGRPPPATVDLPSVEALQALYPPPAQGEAAIAHMCGLQGFGVGIDGVNDECPACRKPADGGANPAYEHIIAAFKAGEK